MGYFIQHSLINHFAKFHLIRNNYNLERYFYGLNTWGDNPRG